MLRESFQYSCGRLERHVESGKRESVSTIQVTTGCTEVDDLHHLWWQSILRGEPVSVKTTETLRALDLFCGAGGLALGASLAAASVGAKLAVLASVDVDGEALDVYEHNFHPAASLNTSAAGLVDYHVYGRGESASFAYPPEILNPALEKCSGEIDLILAGPPCQGHSNLNNHSRRKDPRNQLYLTAVAIAVGLSAESIVIENVPDVVADKTKVTDTARRLLQEAGYHVSQATLNASSLGGAQLRRRHFTVASRNAHTSLREALKTLAHRHMTLREAIGDLEDVNATTIMDEVPLLSAENRERINYLFDNEEYDLPNAFRPNSHKGGHTYPSVYGRLRWDRPSQTITTGFMTPGRGRYIHPSRRRVITPHEAARIQGFPDSFAFVVGESVPSRKSLSKWIGDAVPTQLGNAAVLTALSGI